MPASAGTPASYRGEAAQTDAARERGPACSVCPVVGTCLPADVPREQLARVEGMVARQRTLEPGQYLFRVGEPFTCLFAVRAGCLKSTVFDRDGGEHILNFHLPGEVLGFASIYQHKHAGNAVAISTSIVCHLPFGDILALAQTFPQLVLGLLRVASRSSLYTGRLTGDHNAAVRVAAFLLSVSGRLRAQGLSATDFELVMSREDIANHLRLAPETVSRVLTQFNAERLADIRRRSVRLLDESRLQELAGPMLPYG
jgi:CRP/FNR family transcriptional regulator